MSCVAWHEAHRPWTSCLPFPSGSGGGALAWPCAPAASETSIDAAAIKAAFLNVVGMVPSLSRVDRGEDSIKREGLALDPGRPGRHVVERERHRNTGVEAH